MKIVIIVFLIVGFVFTSIAADFAKGTHIKDAKITLRAANGKTYTATTDANGRFEIKNIDEDGDGFTLSVKYDNKTYDKGTSNKLLIAHEAAHVAQQGGRHDVAMNSVRNLKRFSKTITLCKGDADCDGSADRIIIELSSNGGGIQGMAINEKGLPGKKSPRNNNSNK